MTSATNKTTIINTHTHPTAVLFPASIANIETVRSPEAITPSIRRATAISSREENNSHPPKPTIAMPCIHPNLKNRPGTKRTRYKCTCDPEDGPGVSSCTAYGRSNDAEPQYPETVQFCHCSGSNAHVVGGQAAMERIEWQGVDDALKERKDCLWLREMWLAAFNRVCRNFGAKGKGWRE